MFTTRLMPFLVNPMLNPQAAAEPFAIFQGRLISHAQLWSDVHTLADALPDRPYVFNLCENRYLFCISLLAAAARRQICLLPQSSQKAVIQDLSHTYAGAYVASDLAVDNELECLNITASPQFTPASIPNFDWERTALIAFTSGSTGQPQPCAHNLKTFAISAKQALSALQLTNNRRVMISTTSPQHMYGLETSVCWPLFSALILYDGRPFFPEAIRQAIATAPWPVQLATTPTHLRALLKAGGDWPNLAGILSATDHLPAALAQESRAILGQSPLEIYGSTETLSFAQRNPITQNAWTPYSGSRVFLAENGSARLTSLHLPSEISLHDVIQLTSDGGFEILGRHQDMLKIGGKRLSLAELDRRLRAIEGVTDGFCFLQQERISAVVVSTLDRQAIRQGLKTYVDDVFLPRKIHYVPQIPRNPSGKLTQSLKESVLSSLTLA